MEDLRVEELYEIMEEIDSLREATESRVDDLNYRLRKFLETFLIKSNYDYELLDLYYRLGENYEEIRRNPERGLEKIRELVIAISNRIDRLT